VDEFLLGLSLVVVLSIFARLLGTWIGVPAIVPLLAVGVLAGTSVTGLVDPQALLGDSLSPVVQIAVGIILFEGALGLKREELASGVRPAVVRLLTIGVLLTWAMATAGVFLLFDIDFEIAVLIGAVLIVSGPTVVLPILDFIAPSTKVRSVLKWEGILVDPVGAIIAVVIFTSLGTGDGDVTFNISEVAFSIGAGLAMGVAGAYALVPLLSTRSLGKRDKIAATLMVVVAAFALSDAIAEDSGLLATIVMGVFLANQRKLDVDYIIEFKEILIPLLIGILFVLLAANVDVSAVIDLGWRGIALVLILVILVRPLVALVSTARLPFTGKERTFFAAMAPRGIVAASTASAFGLKLSEDGVPGADLVIPVTFTVIAGTVIIYSLGSPPLARYLGLAGNQPPSLMLVGAPRWAIALAAALKQAGAEVRIWTEDEARARTAIDAGLLAFGGPLDPKSRSSAAAFQDLSAVALVSDDDTLNQTLGWEFSSALGSDRVYCLRSPDGAAPVVPSDATPLFGRAGDTGEIEARLDRGEIFRVLEPGEPVPAGATPVASTRRLGGRSKPTVRLVSEDGPALKHPDVRLIVLGPEGDQPEPDESGFEPFSGPAPA
jgi:NhaP-type Na+/H+ or K+/H+ antiporter